MDLEKTQPLPAAAQTPTQQFYRCPCGNDVEVDDQRGGQCLSCQRQIPASVTRHQLSMTMTIATLGQQLEHSHKEQGDGIVDQLIGKRLGHFEIIEPIGHGGMGDVYRALDTSLQRYVAVKIIRGSHGGELDEMAELTLLREAVAQARVNHPHIVTIYYVGREDKIPFLAMELIDGHDVAELIKQGKIPYEQISQIAIKITHALDTASQLGIVHSDIKPQNLLVMNNGHVKLSDFGMARLDDEDDKTFGGTPNYLAPELLSGSQPSIQSDMYALGVTLFEMSFERLPVELSGSTIKQWSNTHNQARIKFPDPWPDHLPDGWKAVLGRLLAKDPKHRFESYEELGQSIRAILPSPSQHARGIPRAMAFVIDSISILLFMLPMVILLQVAESFMHAKISGGLLWNLFLLSAIVAYSLVVYWWRQSLGRELMHIKIVNQYGLQPSRRKMVLRSMLRMSPFWAALIGTFLELMIGFGFEILMSLSLIFIACDIAYTLFVGRGTSLHDRIMKTHAVVGSDAE